MSSCVNYISLKYQNLSNSYLDNLFQRYIHIISCVISSIKKFSWKMLVLEYKIIQKIYICRRKVASEIYLTYYEIISFFRRVVQLFTPRPSENECSLSHFPFFFESVASIRRGRPVGPHETAQSSAQLARDRDNCARIIASQSCLKRSRDVSGAGAREKWVI